MIRSLSTLTKGSRAVICDFSPNELVTRLMEMGLTVGAEIEVAHEAPFGGAIAVRCRGTLIALRIADAALVQVRELE